jgi:hypothetical protein
MTFVCWVIFYFLWGDPIFSETFDRLKASVDDDLIALRRTLVLTMLNLYGMTCEVADKRAADIEEQKELRYQGEWREAQLLKHVSPEVAEQVWIDFNVNRMDPDFSFRSWLDNNDKEIESRRVAATE